MAENNMVDKNITEKNLKEKKLTENNSVDKYSFTKINFEDNIEEEELLEKNKNGEKRHELDESEYDDKDSDVKVDITEDEQKYMKCSNRIYKNPFAPDFTETYNMNTYFGEFPWMLALYYKLNGKLLLVCGASLIAPDVAMTAAHCVYNKDLEYSIRAGDWLLNEHLEDYELQYPENRHVIQRIIHPGYKESTLDNDIALLKLDSEIDYNDHISPVCLPTSPEDYDTHNCAITAWPRESHGMLSITYDLKKSEQNLVPKSKCQADLRKTRLGPYYQVRRSFICAENTTSTRFFFCKGDGGAPLICPSKKDPQKYIQVGISSWNVDCKNKELPGLYTRVDIYNMWIAEKLKDLDKIIPILV